MGVLMNEKKGYAAAVDDVVSGPPKGSEADEMEVEDANEPFMECA